MELTLTPGAWVQHPDHPEWGTGRVQSAIGTKITVNFEDAGKVTIDTRHIRLELIRPADSDPPSP